MEIVVNNKEQPKLILALGSGASRGWAHIGVIEALEEAGLQPDGIAGTSVGSYIGAVYAGGGLSSLKEFLFKMDGKRVFSYFDISPSRSGLLDGNKKLRELFESHTKARTFDDLNIPVKMVAADLYSGRKVIIDSGDLLHAMRASMSLPGLFEPVKRNGRWLVDGGLVDPVPISVARAMGGDVVVAVDLNADLMAGNRPRGDQDRDKVQENRYKSVQFGMLDNFLKGYEKVTGALWRRISSMFGDNDEKPYLGDVISSSIDIAQDRITRINLAVEPPDILIQPRLVDYQMLDFDRVEEAIEEGHGLMKERIPSLRKLLGQN